MKQRFWQTPASGIILILLGLPVYWYLSKYGRPIENGDIEDEE